MAVSSPLQLGQAWRKIEEEALVFQGWTVVYLCLQRLHTRAGIRRPSQGLRRADSLVRASCKEASGWRRLRATQATPSFRQASTSHSCPSPQWSCHLSLLTFPTSPVVPT